MDMSLFASRDSLMKTKIELPPINPFLITTHAFMVELFAFLSCYETPAGGRHIMSCNNYRVLLCLVVVTVWRAPVPLQT